MGIIDSLKAKEKFSTTEKTIADYILHNQEKVIYSTIRELALATYTSNSAVMRTIRKVYNGSFQDFKVRLTFELQSLTANEDSYIHLDKHDTIHNVMDKIARLEIKTIEETKAILDFDQMKRVLNYIYKAKKISLYAESINLQTANEVRYMLARVGKHVEVILEEGFTTLNGVLADQQQVAIFISHRRKNITLTKKMIVNYNNRIPIIYISGYSNPDIDKYCNEVIRVKHGIPYSELAPIVYTTSIKFVLNVILSAVIVNDLDNCQEQLESYMKMLKS